MGQLKDQVHQAAALLAGEELLGRCPAHQCPHLHPAPPTTANCGIQRALSLNPCMEAGGQHSIHYFRKIMEIVTVTEAKFASLGEAPVPVSQRALGLCWAGFLQLEGPDPNPAACHSYAWEFMESWRNVLYGVAGSYVYSLKEEIPTQTTLLVSSGERLDMDII